MTEQACRAIIERWIKPMRGALWLGFLKTTILYDSLDVSTYGTCNPDPHYRRLTIVIDPGKAKDDPNESTDVLRTLRHELLHGTLIGFELYRLGVAEALTIEMFNALDQSFRAAVENAVAAQEDYLDGAGLTPWKLAGRSPTRRKR